MLQCQAVEVEVAMARVGCRRHHRQLVECRRHRRERVAVVVLMMTSVTTVTLMISATKLKYYKYMKRSRRIILFLLRDSARRFFWTLPATLHCLCFRRNPNRVEWRAGGWRGA